MNKQICAIFFIMLLSLVSSIPAQAATTAPDLRIDGIDVTATVKPEMKNNHMMVPLRAVSESLGATAQQTKNGIQIIQADKQIMLQPGNTKAVQNGKTIKLDAKPYISKGVTYVPLRFVAETMGATVGYSRNIITIDSQPLWIGSAKIKATQYEYHMTMGGVVEQVYGNAYNTQLYHILTSNKGKQVQAPEHFSWQYTLDIPGSYSKNAQYEFLDTKGKTIAQYDTYNLVSNIENDSSKNLPAKLLHDVTANRWYVTKQDIAKLTMIQLDRAWKNGFIVVISDTVV
ncbi:copper amine oxidase N-terminal domain-containing protein [Paenibacillus sp. WLX1005]|uniref:copper amine oxidase N-terminal domain-containing protein n=1 Tax=Paenibacillus sp. WLX1005 TaxID=3243766 RepID=UPI0039843624